MKLFKWLAASGFAVIIVFFGARGCAANRDPLAFVDVNARGVTVVSHQSHGSLTDNEDFLVLQATPTQFTSIMKQIKSRPKTAYDDHGFPNSPQANAFVAAAPPRAPRGSFAIEKNKGEKSQWFILCDYAADRTTGRIYFYAWSVYN